MTENTFITFIVIGICGSEFASAADGFSQNPNRSTVCQDMSSWMEILKHFSSTQCQTLNNTVSANIQDFCTVAAVEIFVDCKKEHADSSTIDECLTGILGTLPSFSSLFSSCLCHGYIENYASMWAVWNMICDEDAPPYKFW